MKQTASSFTGTTGKIFFLITGLALIPILTISAFLYYLEHQNVKNHYHESAGQNAHFQAQYLNDQLSDARMDLRLLADTAEAVLHDPELVHRLLEGYVRNRPIVSGAAAVDPQGKIIAGIGLFSAVESTAGAKNSEEGAGPRVSHTYLAPDNEHQWTMVMVQGLPSEGQDILLKFFIPLQEILRAGSLFGSFHAGWSALFDDQGNALCLYGIGSIDEKLFLDYPALSLERQGLVRTEIRNKQDLFQMVMVPLAQESMVLGLAFDFKNFTAVHGSLMNQILFFAAGWTIVILMISYAASLWAAAYLARREIFLKALNQQVIEGGKMVSIGELASGIAHEINNPVAIMVEEAGWMQDLLKEEPEPALIRNFDELNRSLNQIRNQGRRCKDIIRKLLIFARKSDSRIQDVDLNALIEVIAAVSDRKAKKAGVVINLDLDPSVPSFRSSSAEMQQVFLNMINNAIDAMDGAGGELNISSRKDRKGLLFRFSDTGEGIAGKYLKKIFDPFFTTRPVGKGAGLGLSICDAIVQNLGGKITVTSRTGKGTTFLIRLPCPQDKADQKYVGLKL